VNARAALLAAASLCMGLTAASGRAEDVPIGRYVELPFGVTRAHPYPTSAANARRNGRVDVRAPAEAPSRRLLKPLGTRRLTPPAVLDDGTLVLGSARGLHAVGPDGAPRWEVDLGQVRFTPAVLPSGELLAVTHEGRAFRVTADGQARVLRTPVALLGMPLVLDGGAVLVGGRKSSAHVVDTDGHVLLSVATRVREPVWTARLGGGLLVAAGVSRELTLLSLHAGLERTLSLPERAIRPPVVGNDGRLWVVGDHGTLFGLEADGRVRTTVLLGARGATAPVVGRDGNLRIGLPSREILCVGPDGRERWRRGIDGRPGPLLLDADDTLLVVSARGTLHAIDRDGELRYRVMAGARGAGRPVLGPDGTVYLVSRDGRLQAFR
jgi:outer membrane protein assembly factor BamB